MTGSFEAFGLALAVFFISHSIPAIRPLRRRVVAAVGERTYLVLYSLASIAILAWVVAAALTAPYLPIWPHQDWMSWVPAILMIPACILVVCGATAANPLSIGFHGGSDPQPTGVVAITRHPLLWAFALWSGSHLVPNGDLTTVILFGLLTAFALLGMPLIDAKRRRALGADRWRDRAAKTSIVPFAAVLQGRSALRFRDIGVARLTASALLYGLFVAFHAWILGVWPLPHWTT